MKDLSAAALFDRPSLTKIIATLGPATDEPGVLERLIASGVSVVRLNFSHGTLDEHKRRLDLARGASAKLGQPVAVLGDLGGPKIRVSSVEGEIIEVQSGQDVVFRTPVAPAPPGSPPTPAPGPVEADVPVISCSYAPLTREVAPGQRVLLGDGQIRMLAVDRRSGVLRCRVTVGGTIKRGMGVNLPDSDISAPAITARDRECVEWAVAQGLDFLALSFVRSADDVAQLKMLLRTAAARIAKPAGGDSAVANQPIPVIAKIEKPQAVESIDEILSVADGIMVARGDLGVELDLAQVPVVQKRLIAMAREHGKPCVVATQMLESMIDKATPTRAEASDVANAIFDGAGAVMLSGETAVGKHPALVVETMRRIALAAEEEIHHGPQMAAPPARLRAIYDAEAALAHGAWHMANDTNAAMVAVWSQTGEMARSLAQNKFRVLIAAYSSDEAAVRRMALLRGVIPVMCLTLPAHRTEFAAMVDRMALEKGWTQPGQRMVLLAGMPFGKSGVVNTVALRTAGELAGLDVLRPGADEHEAYDEADQQGTLHATPEQTQRLQKARV
ncbi:MAG: pyruvate kinase [Phycisphaeraceae bacterium]|nr:pyruvate kinase [Phycisphaeraceae bacterium]